MAGKGISNIDVELSAAAGMRGMMLGFSGPCALYRVLALRHKARPAFMHRNLTYIDNARQKIDDRRHASASASTATRRRKKGPPLEHVLKTLKAAQASKQAACCTASETQPAAPPLQFQLSQAKFELIEGVHSVSSVTLVLKQNGQTAAAILKTVDVSGGQPVDTTVEVPAARSGYTMHFDIVCTRDAAALPQRSSKRRRTDGPEDDAPMVVGQVKLTTAPATIFGDDSDGRYELLLWEDESSRGSRPMEAQGSFSMLVARAGRTEAAAVGESGKHSGTEERVLDLSTAGADPGPETSRSAASASASSISSASANRPRPAASAHTAASARRRSGKGSGKRCPPIEYEFRNKAHFWRCKGPEDSRCPWCGLDCGEDIRSLMMHLTHCHSRLLFTFEGSKNGGRVVVSVAEARCDPANPADGNQIIFVPEPLENFCVHVISRATHSGVSKFADHGAHGVVEDRRRVPSARKYYHTDSLLPANPDSNEPDSESDENKVVIFEHIKKGLDDFSDVNPAEKGLMKLWNGYLLAYPILADFQVYGACKSFITTYSADLQSLQNNFCLHLATLFEFGIFTSVQVHDLVEQLNAECPRTLG